MNRYDVELSAGGFVLLVRQGKDPVLADVSIPMHCHTHDRFVQGTVGSSRNTGAYLVVCRQDIVTDRGIVPYGCATSGLRPKPTNLVEGELLPAAGAAVADSLRFEWQVFMKFVVLGDIGRNGLYHVGDEAMTEVAIEALQHRGASGITLVATHPEEATRIYGLPSVARIGFSRSWTLQSREAALAPLADGALEPGSAVDHLSTAIASADAVIIAGGGNMNAEFAHHIDERVALTRLARRHRRPLFVAGQTIGPNLSERDGELMTEILEYATAFAVRDDASYELALDLGASVDRLHRISDDGVLLNPNSEIPSTRAGLVRGRYIVGSFTSDPGRSGLSRDAYLAQVSRMLDQLAEELDVDVFLIPHVASLTGPAPIVDELSDRSISERSLSGRVFAVGPVQAREALAIMADAQATISTRYHPVVFGPAVGIPTIGIALSQYSVVRMRGALEPIGMDAFVIPFNAWDTILPAAREVFNRVAEYRTWVTAQVESRNSLQEQWWDGLARLSPPTPLAPSVAEQFPVHGSWARHAQQARKLLPITEQVSPSGTMDVQDQAQALTRRNKVLNQDLERTRSQLRTAQSRKVVRLTDKVGDAVRGLMGSRTAPPVEAPPLEAPPLLSVVVPIYNVEQYLVECLESIRVQTLTDLEVILIDDGSTDSSGRIAEEFAAQDARFILHRQENAGLGAVRNRGQSMATGTYVAFIDSDDVVPRRAFKALVDTLVKSGSDVAIGRTTRIRPDGSPLSSKWSTDLHNRDYQTTLAASPRLLRDFYTWNKVFSQEFWRAHDFQFREGVLFEDQPVITEIMLLARSIDVLTTTTYNWRQREDNSSLTGSMYSTRDIVTRHQATRLTFETLLRHGASEDIQRWWFWTLVQHHFPNYLKATAKLESTEEYDAVIAMVREFMTVEQIVDLGEPTAAKRALVYLALTASQTKVAQYLAEGGSNTSNAELVFVDGELRADLPLHDEIAPEHAHVLRVSGEEQRLVAIITAQEWGPSGTLQLVARIGVSQGSSEQEFLLRVSLVSADRTVKIDLPCSYEFLEPADTPRKSGVALWAEARITVEAAVLAEEHHEVFVGGLHLHLEVESQGSAYCGPVTGTEVKFQGSALSSSKAIALDWAHPRGLSVKLRKANVRATDLRQRGQQLDIDFRVASDFVPSFVILRAADTPTRRYLARRIGQAEYAARVDTDWISPGIQVTVLMEDEAGKRQDVHALPANEGAAGQDFQTVTTPRAQLRLTFDKAQTSAQSTSPTRR